MARHITARLGRKAVRLATLAVACTALAGAALAADEVFTVANYPVEARADNAVTAKNKALADGQQAAFRSLLKRLVAVTAYARIKALDSAKGANLVEGVSVRSERNSTTEYIANLDFTFQAKGVRELLRREGIPFTDEQAPAVTVIPVWRTASAGDEAAWTNAWKGLDLEHAVAPVKLQALKKDIKPESIGALAGGDGSVMRALVSAYGSELVVAAVAEHDAAAKRLNVTLTGRDAVGAFSLTRAYRIDASDAAYAKELAAVVSLGVLEGRWKAIRSGATGPSAAGSADLQIMVEFRGMSEWQDISRKLGATPGVAELDVAGLSARGARVTLRYPGGAEQLASGVAQQGLALRNVGGNWVLGLQ